MICTDRYIPTLAKALLDKHTDTKLVNLHGLWATDPCTDTHRQFGSLDISVSFVLGVRLWPLPICGERAHTKKTYTRKYTHG